MREAVFRAVEETKLVAIVRGILGEDCLKMADALYAGGIRAMEVTFNLASEDVSATTETLRMLTQHFRESMVIGAGTVTSVAAVELAKAAGAEFIVSPDTNGDVIRRTRELEMVSMPGALTPTEILTAARCGADIVKLFPAAQLGPDYIKAVRAPVSNVKLMAVGGIDTTNLAAFLRAGAVGAGIGNCLTNKQWISNGEYAKIQDTAAEFIRIAASC